MKLKEKMKHGPVFGVAIFTSAACAVEAVGNWGYDFVFLDLEHTPLDAEIGMEKLIMAALLTGVSPLVRTANEDEVVLRKLVEMGAEGVIVPHTRTIQDVEKIVQAVKFPPLGRRGSDSNVRAAGFGGPGFSYENYIKNQNSDTMIIPMDEDYEFTDNIDAILSNPSVDAINFGPLDYALSMEGSLKLKEISYIHSEAYAGGELKHGTIALIEEGTLVICPMTQDNLVEKMISNIKEVKARGAVVLAIAKESNKQVCKAADVVVTIPDVDSLIAPIVAVTPLQLFAYYMALQKGCDVDKPRNLAKSVTVE